MVVLWQGLLDTSAVAECASRTVERCLRGVGVALARASWLGLLDTSAVADVRDTNTQRAAGKGP